MTVGQHPFVPRGTVSTVPRRDRELRRGKLTELTGSPRFARQAQNLNLIDLALANPGVLRRLGLDPDLLDALSRLTRPALADRLSLSFELPEPERGNVRLRDVRVEEDGIRVRLTGSQLAFDGQRFNGS